ncbi:Low-density lipoprotein receptor domain class A [Branchiostoma belcheri]|nr:Low-density lipoprotein receptor domain class A [Branchiostoma belcheri]
MATCLLLILCLLPMVDGTILDHPVEDECPSSAFKCETTDNCVSFESRCDGELDCIDGSDENCDVCNISLTFKCEGLDVCINLERQCDGIYHCPDASDEASCSVCSVSSFKCPGADVCITQEKQCDYHSDCPDGSDEDNCQECSDSANTLECGIGGACFELWQQCDGYTDCPNGLDEQNCDFPVCPLGMMDCEDGFPFPCLHEALMAKCDLSDCQGAFSAIAMNCISAVSHVHGWDFRECFSTEFKCEVTSICVPLSRVCDGVNDCGDVSDESCGVQRVDEGWLCVPGWFKCKSSTCIPGEGRCDGIRDCDDDSDESGCECTSVEFRCESDHKCVEPSQVCDSYNNCDDETDELLCKTCSEKDLFECGIGECIDKTSVCDGDKDCFSGIDEENCQKLIGFQWFECNGMKFSYNRFCDGFEDCLDWDAKDEMNCATRGWLERSTSWVIDATSPFSPGYDAYNVLDVESGPWYIIFDLLVPYKLNKISMATEGGISAFKFQRSASSIRYEWEDVTVVTGAMTTTIPQDFGGFSATSRFWKLVITATGPENWQPWLDEVMFFGQRVVCGKDQFSCADGICLMDTLLCNNQSDCSKGEDEEGCKGHCNSLQLECDDRCLPRYHVCDGVENCLNGIDEDNCVSGGCGSKEFRCSDGVCLTESQLCNSQPDCREGEDEDDCGDPPPPGHPLGLESRYIPDAFITASSEYKTEFASFQTRYTPTSTTGYCWVPQSVEEQWLQVYLGKTTDVTGVVISGGGSNWDLGSWVTSFTLAFSMDGASWTPYKGNSSSVMVFPGNRDRYNKVSRPFPEPVTSRYIRLYPTGYEGWIALVMEVYVTNDEDTWLNQEGYFPLGVGIAPNNSDVAAKIPHHALRASSRADDFYPRQARLNNGEGLQQGACWSPAPGLNTDQWLQIQHDKIYKVMGVITQGAYNLDHWVTSYKLAFRNRLDVPTWTTYTNSDGDDGEMVFQGNTDSHRYVRHMLDSPVDALFTRFYPLTFHKQIAMRVEILVTDTVEINSQFSRCSDDASSVPEVFHSSQACDGRVDCSTGKDEANCDECAMECTTGSDDPCIPHGWICDGFEDCLDQKDEQRCLQGVSKDCFFTCLNNVTCLPTRQLGDGIRDCASGEDEKPNYSVRDPYTWRVRACTRPGYEPLRCPGRVQACTRLHTPPLVTGADISLVWAPVVRSRPKLFIPRCATSLAEAVTHGPNILCHSTALSRDTVYSPEGCTSYLRRVTCAGPYIPVHTTNYQVSGHVRRYHRPAHAVADISCTHPDTPGHAKFHGTCTVEEVLYDKWGSCSYDCPSVYGNAFCVPDAFNCDGNVDCLEGEDEQRCDGFTSAPTNEGGDCATVECFLPGVPEPYCLPDHLICDGHPDCVLEEDEQGCAHNTGGNGRKEPTEEPTGGQEPGGGHDGGQERTGGLSDGQEFDEGPTSGQEPSRQPIFGHGPTTEPTRGQDAEPDVQSHGRKDQAMFWMTVASLAVQILCDNA